jgi:response regulator RpfG family c-di-GMP phosphodiesterase
MGGKAKILFVDDDPEILATLKRTFRRQYLVETALGPLRGLEVAAEHGPFAVVVADLRMPGLNGLEFFAQLKKISPETVRVMLTGYADLRAAMDAVNTGHVFRFLAKPCPEEDLADSLAAAVALYAQATAERDFLKGALRGIIKLLSDLLALQNPEAYARAMRVRRLVADMARYLDAPDAWRIELAVTLSQLGGLVLPQGLFAKLRRTGDLTGDEARLFARHPGLAGDLLANIPKLDEVAAIIRHQDTPHAEAGPEVPLGARLLKAALDYDVLLTSGRARDQALDAMAGREGRYAPQALDALATLAGEREGLTSREIPLSALTPGMILEEDVALPHTTVIAASGEMVDAGWLACLEAESLPGDVRCRVLAPPAEDAPPPGLADPELLALLRRVGRAQGSP